MLTGDRIKHMYAVAKLMKEMAVEKGFSEELCEDMFLLGFVHDIGYEFLGEKDYAKHNVVGAGIMKNQGYKYWQEICYHGVANSPYQSSYLDLLNCADMHIDSKGNYVSYQDRLEEIAIRYNQPAQTLECYKLIQELMSKDIK